MTNSELHEAESCRNLGCSPPETLELGARGNAAKETELGRRPASLSQNRNGASGLHNRAALPPVGCASPQKTEKRLKTAFNYMNAAHIFFRSTKMTEKTQF